MKNTFQTMSFLAKPVGDDRISERALGYVTEAAREDAFDLVVSACVEAGVQRAAIARRLGKDPAQVTRLLNAPGNWTVDTISELLFAIDGSLLRHLRFDPLSQPVANDRFPKCLEPVEVAPGKVFARVGTETTASRPNEFRYVPAH